MAIGANAIRYQGANSHRAKRSGSPWVFIALARRLVRALAPRCIAANAIRRVGADAACRHGAPAQGVLRYRGPSGPSGRVAPAPLSLRPAAPTARGADAIRPILNQGAVGHQSPRRDGTEVLRRRVAPGVSASDRRDTEVPMIAGTEKPMANGTHAPMLIGDNSPRYPRDHDPLSPSTGAPSTIRTEETSLRGNIEPR
jgi:hypothetical protein